MKLAQNLYSKCDYNLIQNKILHALLQNSICMERSARHKMFSKGQNVNIFIILHVHLWWFLAGLMDTHVPETVPRRYAKQEICLVLMRYEWKIRMSLYIFLLLHIYHLCFTCIDFYYLSAWGGCWFVVYIRRFIYKFLNVCPFDYTAVAGSGKVGPVNQVNHISWVAVVTPTDRPKSVRNRCIIELFCGVVWVVTLPFWHFCWCRGFCHRTESYLFLFLQLH